MKLSNCYCINLRNASGIIAKIYDEHLAPYGITVRQYSMMKNLERLGEASVTELAEYIELERTSVVRMLRPLTEREYILDMADSGKRNRRLVLSDLGKKVITEATPAWQAAQNEIEEKLGKENIEAMMRMIEVL